MESNIKRLRKDRRLSQTQLGDAIGLSQQVISRIEHDRDKIQTDVLIHLADFFEVSTDCVLGYHPKGKDMSGWNEAWRQECAAGDERYADIDRLQQMDEAKRTELYSLLLQIKRLL